MLLVALTMVVAAGGADPTLEPPIIKDAAPLEEMGRYRSPRTFDETLDFYQRLFNQPGVVRWRTIVNLPGIRAKHIESLRKKTKWEGINIYEYKGEVRLYVVPRDTKKRKNGADDDKG